MRTYYTDLSHNCELILHNYNFLSCRREISCNWDFLSCNWDFRSQNWDFLSCNCKLISHSCELTSCFRLLSCPPTPNQATATPQARYTVQPKKWSGERSKVTDVIYLKIMRQIEYDINSQLWEWLCGSQFWNLKKVIAITFTQLQLFFLRVPWYLLTHICLVKAAIARKKIACFLFYTWWKKTSVYFISSVSTVYFYIVFNFMCI